MALPFHTTRWSLVARAGDFAGGGADSPARAALDELVRAYWPALFAFARSRGETSEEAADLVQGFFARAVEKGGLVPRERRARFRSFLLAAFQHFAANEAERAAAVKRGGGERGLALDELAREDELVSSGDEPARAFERRYARRVLERAFTLLREEQAAVGQAARLARLEPHLVGEDGAVPYAELALELGTSAGALKVAVHRLRRRFGELLRAEVAGTLTDPGEVDAELGELMAALAR
ncbi:MAG: sigma-70 family RNA polymerase sigma factor [Planctomycetes bacterium]|nr:sigma-70 family RNA polymerase sigma factor [Planctomycetota bacterium]